MPEAQQQQGSVGRLSSIQADRGAVGASAPIASLDRVLSTIGNREGGPPAPAPTPAPAPDPAPNPAPVAPSPAPVVPDAGPAASFGGIPADILGAAGVKAGAPQAPAPAAAPAEPEGDEPDEPKAKNAWQRIKQEKKDLQTRVKALETEVERAKAAKPPEVDELIQMRKQMDAYEDRIGQLDITQTKAFKAQFDDQLNAVGNKGMSILLRTGMEKEQAQALLVRVLDPRLSAQKMEALVSDQPMSVQGALLGVATEYAEVLDRRDAAVTNWRDTKAALAAAETRDADIKLTVNVEADAETGVTQAVKDGNWLFTRASGESAEVKAWNEQVDTRVKLVKTLLRSASRADLAKWVFEGVTARETRELFTKAVEERNALLSKFNGVVARTPGLGANGQPGAGGGGGAHKPVSPDSVIAGLKMFGGR